METFLLVWVIILTVAFLADWAKNKYKGKQWPKKNYKR